MAKALQVLKPLKISTGNIVYSNVPDNDYEAWSSGTAYTVGQYVKVGIGVYQCVKDNTGANPTDRGINGDKWREMGVINRMKPFDDKLSTKVRQANTITYHLSVGQAITSVSIKGVDDATSVQVRLVSGVNVYYDETRNLASTPAEVGWWHWLWGAREGLADAIFNNIPTQSTATLEITILGSANLAVGVIAVGVMAEYGEYTLAGTSVSLNNYAYGGLDDWGDQIIKPLSWSKTATINVILRKHEVDALQKLVARSRFNPCVWIASEDFESLHIYGFVESWDAPLQWDYIEARLTIRGLPE